MNRAPSSSMISGRLDRIPHRCLIRIKGLYDSLKRAERMAADYLLSAPEEVSEIGVVEFAQRAGCSEATVVRLAQRLGYDGFPELKAEFAKIEDHGPYRNIQAADPPEAVVKKVFANSIQALSDTLEALDLKQYHQAVEALSKARRMAFFGLGNAAVVAREAFQKFLRIGVSCYTAEDPDLQLIIVNSQLARNDVLVAISYSGESRPILAAARQAQRRGVKVLAITNFPRGTLARMSDIVLLTAVFQEHVNGEIGSKRLAQLCVLESLYVNYLMRQGPATRQKLLATHQAVSANKSSIHAKPDLDDRPLSILSEE